MCCVQKKMQQQMQTLPSRAILSVACLHLNENKLNVRSTVIWYLGIYEDDDEGDDQ